MKQILKHKKILIAICVIAIVLDMAYCINERYLSKSSEPEVAEEPVLTEQDIMAARFDHYLALLNSSVKDSVLVGLEGMGTLAKEGNAEAMYQIAYTYVWAPTDTISVERKKHLGIDVNQFGLPESEEANVATVAWLKKTIEQDSTHYMAMYYLGYYYLNGFAVERDSKVAKELFVASKAYAQNVNDTECVGKIDKVLNAIEKR